MKTYKKYLIFLAVLIVLCPLGLIVPNLFKAGDAWGEWSVESVKEQTGKEPAGMAKTATIYDAPVPDYNLGKEEDSMVKLSASYIISGLIGTGIILILTFASVKLMSHRKDT
jgi:cobalt/nickel transport protein